MIADELTAVLPLGAVGCEQVGPHQGWLFAEEAALVASAGPARRAAFTAGRSCARHALEALGFAAAPMLRSEGRAPAWPPGVTGSLTHCEGYCAATVARMTVVASLGIDAEPDAPLPPGVAALVFTPAEAAWLGAAPPGGLAWDRLVFSIKESVYKAWSPLTDAWLDFQQVEVTLDPTRRRFEAAIDGVATAPAAPRRVAGRFVVHGAHLLTCAAISPADLQAVRRR